MKDNKRIYKGKKDQTINFKRKFSELKESWQELDKKLSSNKSENHTIHSPNTNYSYKRLSEFKSILSKEYSKMEDWIKVLETISKTLVEFMDDVYPQNRQSSYIKKLLEKKDLMPLETVEKFLQLMEDEGKNSEAKKVLLDIKQNTNEKGEFFRNTPRIRKPSEQQEAIESYIKANGMTWKAHLDKKYTNKEIIQQIIDHDDPDLVLKPNTFRIIKKRLIKNS